MQAAPPLIAYASEPHDVPADGLLRRIVAWSAILYGGRAVTEVALHVALVKRWFATPATVSYSFGGRWEVTATAVQALTMSALIVGGVLMLRRSRAAVPVVRAGLGCALALPVWGYARFVASPYAQFTPATVADQALGIVNVLAFPLVMVLLTLPPLARRMA